MLHRSTKPSLFALAAHVSSPLPGSCPRTHRAVSKRRAVAVGENSGRRRHHAQAKIAAKAKGREETRQNGWESRDFSRSVLFRSAAVAAAAAGAPSCRPLPWSPRSCAVCCTCVLDSRVGSVCVLSVVEITERRQSSSHLPAHRPAAPAARHRNNNLRGQLAVEAAGFFQPVEVTRQQHLAAGGGRVYGWTVRG